MLLIFDGKEKDAGEIQKLIEEQITDCEHNEEIAHEKEGLARLNLNTKKIWQGKELSIEKENILSRNEDLKNLFGEPKEEKTVINRVIEDRETIISSSLNIAISDFPDGFSFGNGVTCNAQVVLNNGNVKRLSWVVFNKDKKSIVDSKYEKLKDIFESQNQ